jgi:hypothetical protein
MKILRLNWKVASAGLAGFLAGIALTRTTSVRAQSDPDTTTVVVSGGAESVVGFSCLLVKNETKCYVAKAVRMNSR